MRWRVGWPVKGRIDVIGAFGRLDEGEVDSRASDTAPVDVALPARDVDTVHILIVGMAIAPGMGAAVAQLRCLARGVGRTAGAASASASAARGRARTRYRQHEQQPDQDFSQMPHIACPTGFAAALRLSAALGAVIAKP